jgi:hypothetical protein
LATELTVRDIVLGPFKTSELIPRTPPTGEQIEDWAILSESTLLTAEGCSVRVAGWPDRERRRNVQVSGVSTPDCLLEIDDQISAVEVKEFWAGETGGRQDVEWSRFQDLVREELMADVEALGCGVLAQVGFRQWPTQKLLPDLSSAFINAFRGVLPELKLTGSAFLVRRFPLPTVAAGLSASLAQQFTNLEFRLLKLMAPNVLFMATDSMLTFTPGPEYDKTVDDLLRVAGRQLKSFERARVFVAAHPPFVASLLEQALLAREAAIPKNWRAVTAAVLGGSPIRVWERTGSEAVAHPEE